MDNTTVDLDNLSVKEPDTQEHRPVDMQECYLLSWYEPWVVPPNEDDSEDDGEPHTIMLYWRLVFRSEATRQLHITEYLKPNGIKYHVDKEDDYTLPGMRGNQYVSKPPSY